MYSSIGTNRMTKMEVCEKKSSMTQIPYNKQKNIYMYVKNVV